MTVQKIGNKNQVVPGSFSLDKRGLVICGLAVAA